MFTIGEFSRLCMVTTKTLRHYDRIGLLTPAHTSDGTGYRYYEASQFRDMLFILRCKDYGFTLEETAELLHADTHMTLARFAVKYEQQRNELKHQRRLLEKMREDMELLRKGIDIMNQTKTEIKIVETQPLEIVSERATIAIKDFDKLFGRVMKKLGDNNLQCTGGIIALYHSSEFDPESTDVEIGAVMAAKNNLTRTLPGGPCVMGVHLGAYGGLSEAYAAIVKWIEEKGYRITAQPYEKYLNDPCEGPEEQLVTEIYFPIEK